MVVPIPEGDGADTHTGVNMITAIRMALRHAIKDDGSVIVLGEDVGKKGGVFCATEGLQQEFGIHRVFNVSLSEALIAGMAVGLGNEGIKAVAEFQFAGFIFPGFDQIYNQASRMRNRTRGRLTCPIVFRAPCGSGASIEHHVESPEALFSHIPGLRVVIPSSPSRAYGLLLAAINDPDPVLFLEPIRLYRDVTIKEEVIDDGKELPLDKAFINKEGSDVTLVSWGGTLLETMKAANELEGQGISAEVIDVASITYFDFNTILKSVQKTGRCIVVHEAQRTNGFGAEVAASIADTGFKYLKAPIKRITGLDTVVPYRRLEKYYFPSVAEIIETTQNLVNIPKPHRSKKPTLLTNNAVTLTPEEEDPVEELDVHTQSMAREISKAESGNVTTSCKADIHLWEKGTNPMVRMVRALARACKAYPQFNAHYYHNDSTLQKFSRIDMGIAVNIINENGRHRLFVPILRDAGNMSDDELQNAISELVQKTIDNKLTLNDYAKPTISLSNAGALCGEGKRADVEYATPVIVPPIVAILATGAIKEEVVVSGGEIVAHKVLPLSLTFDHRPFTGGEGIYFLGEIKYDLELQE